MHTGVRHQPRIGGRCVFPSFFRSVFHPCPATFLSSGMFSCFSLPSSSLSPEDGFLSFSEKKEKEEDRLPCRIAIFRLPSREAVFFVPSAKCVFLPSLKKRKRKEGNCHAVRILRQERGAAILLAFSSGRTFPSFFPKKEKKVKTGASESVITEEGVSCQWKREREKRKKRKKGILLSAGLPSLGKERREKAGVSVLRNGSSLLQKKGNASSAQGRISSCLSFRKKKRRKEKHRPFLAAPPFSYVPSSALF